MRDLSIVHVTSSKGAPLIGGTRYPAVTDPQANAGKPGCSIVTISSIIQTVIVILLTAVASGVDADVLSGEQAADEAWSDNIRSLYVAGSGDNPWALPQTQKHKPQGPSYQVNPHYVTPEDIESDSLSESKRRSRERGSASKGAPDNNYRTRQQGLPYGQQSLPYGITPGYTAPGYGGYYGGYYGGSPWGDVGAPGFGGNPMLYPYGGGMDLGDPYNLLMEPYPSGSEDQGGSNGM
jgi:hypothetical protein